MKKITFTVRITELRDLSNYVTWLMDKAGKAIDTADYFNLILFCKLLADKAFNVNRLYAGKLKLKIKIDLNTYRSLELLYLKHNFKNMSSSPILSAIIAELNQQYVSIQIPNYSYLRT